MTAPSRSFTRHLPTVGRILMGLPMVAAGAIGLVHPMPSPPTLAPGAVAFTNALRDSGYMLPMIAVTQLVAGLLLLANRFVPLALALLAPFFVNAVLFHLFLEHGGLVPALLFLILEAALAWHHRGAYASMLRARD